MANLSNINDKFLVTTGGNVLIGQTGAIGSSILQVTGASTFSGNITGTTAVFSGSGTILSLNRNAPGTSLIELKIANTIEGYLGATTTKSFVVYNEAGSEKAHVENNGNIGLYGSAINFLIGDFAEINFRESGAITIDSDNNQSSRNFQIKDGSGSSLMLIEDTGNVGIGTVSPGSDLTIKENGVIGFQYTTGAGSFHTITGGGVNPMSFTVNPFSALDPVFSFNSAAGNIMTMRNGGNVGIGTSSPDGKLQVTAASSTTSNGNDASFKLYLTNTDTTNNNYSLINFTDSDGGSSSGGMGLQYTDHANNYGDLCFITRGSGGYGERMRIDSVGNVGIGTDSPNGKLTILENNAPSKGDFDFQQIVYNGGWSTNVNGLAAIQWSDGVGSSNTIGRIGVTYTGSQGQFQIKDLYYGGYAGSGVVFTVRGDGNVGIGTTGPGHKLVSSVTSPSYSVVGQHASGGQVGIYSSTGDNGIGTINNYALNLFTNNSAPQVTLLTSGNVGIGTTGPQALLDVSKNNSVIYDPTDDLGQRSGTATIHIANQTATTNTFGQLMYDSRSSGQGIARIVFLNGGSATVGIAFVTEHQEAKSEKMRITSNGDILFGTSGDPNGTSIYGSAFTTETSNRMLLRMASSTTGAINLVQFYNGNGLVGKIQTSGSATSYVTSSDYRLKENVIEMTGALDRVSQLKPSRFNFITDADKTVDGFLAHEVQEIVPEAITGEKDAVDEEGNPDYQGIDQSKLVPLLVAAIQELKADNDSLKARIETLENN
jgi:hypothetical protein